MLIAVEGPDNSGKTTLAHRLAKDLGAVFIKTNVRPVTPKVMTKFHQLAQDFESAFDVVVLDRHHAISEPIYGGILRKGHLLTALECSLACSDLHVVYCRRTLVQLQNWVTDIPQLAGVKERIAEIHQKYEQLFVERRWAFKSIQYYDWAETPYPPLLQALKERM